MVGIGILFDQQKRNHENEIKKCKTSKNKLSLVVHSK